MTPTVAPQEKNDGLRMMICYSVIIHVCVFVVAQKFHFPTHFKEAPVYYVDILNLPVANPQAGVPSSGETSVPPSQPAPTGQREMSIPAKLPAKMPATKPEAKPTKKPEPVESSREFDERIARLEREADARHAASALESLKKRGMGKGPAGMPGGKGTEAGSDYASWLKSRLEDEFRSTIAYQSKNPEVYIKLAISQNGRFTRQQIVQSSRDKLFEDSVFRAIALAEKNLRPPPSGKPFEIIIKFSPQGIGKP
jgi:colicin import membrane protein